MGAYELTHRGPSEAFFSIAMKPSLSVIILTYNEEANLGPALDSVKGWATEIFIVDSYSTDRTVDIALERAVDGVRIVQHRFKNYSDQWNWAISHLPIKSDWTLKLDADERVTAEFREEVDELLRTVPADLDGIQFRRFFVFMGKVLRFAWTLNYDLRLWRTGRAVFEERSVGEHPLVEGRLHSLKSYVEHHNDKSISDWLDKHNRYASLEAINLIQGNLTGGFKPRLFGTPTERRMWLRKWYYRVPGRPLLYFLYRYFLRLAFLDGVVGFRFTFLHSSYMYWVDLKRAEYRITGELPTVIWPQRGLPHPLVVHSDLQRQVDAESTKPEPNALVRPDCS